MGDIYCVGIMMKDTENVIENEKGQVEDQQNVKENQNERENVKEKDVMKGLILLIDLDIKIISI